MSAPLEQPPLPEQVLHKIDYGRSVYCEFEALPRELQLKIAKELSKGELPTTVEIRYEDTAPGRPDVMIV